MKKISKQNTNSIETLCVYYSIYEDIYDLY